jgi:phosphate transport system protein
MQTHFEQELAELKEKLLLMAGHAETAVREALQALLERDEQLARRVK